MYTPDQLFRFRRKQETRRMLKAWGSILDWSVWIYLLIPGVVVLGGLYREWWLNMPDWAYNVPWTAVYPVGLFLMLMLTGQVTVPVEAADKLFLLQRPQWLERLKLRAMLYTAVRSFILFLLPYALLLPFLLKVEELSLWQIGQSYVYTAVMCLLVAYAGLTSYKRSGWRKWLLEAALLVAVVLVYLGPMMAAVSHPALLPWCVIIMVPVMLVIMLIGVRMPLRFEAAVKDAETARHKSTELLMSQVMEPQPLIRWKRPYVFRRSQRIFRKRDDAAALLAELRIKAFLRAMTHVRVWVGFISIASYAVNLVPVPVALVLLVSLPMIGNSWLQLQWRQWFTEAFIAQYRWSEADVKQAIWLSRFWLLLPPILLWTAIAGYKLEGVWTALLAAIAAGFVWRSIRW